MDLMAEARRLPQDFKDDQILIYGSAISFQVVGALVPLGLFTLALAGFLHLTDVWDDAALKIRPQVSTAGFQVLDSTVRTVIESKQVAWLTLGAAIAMWRLS